MDNNDEQVRTPGTRADDRQATVVRRAREPIHRWARRAAVAYLILFGCAATYAVVTAENVNENTRRIAEQERASHASIYGACHRLNVLRAAFNTSSYHDWQIFSLTVVSLRKQATILPEPKRSQTVSYARQIEIDASAKGWIPLTPCSRAVDRPLSFIAPVVIPFVKQVAPAAAYSVGPGE